MKKLLWLIGIVAVVTIASIHFLLPNSMEVKGVVVINCTPNSAQRSITILSKIKKWWPGSVLNDSQFVYNEDTFSFRPAYFMGAISTVKTVDSTLRTVINILPVRIDSTLIDWRATISSGNGLFERINLYRKKKKLDNKLQALTDIIKEYLSKIENAYDLKITEQRVEDTMLLATRKSFALSPTISQINDMLLLLKNYIKEHNGKQTNPPMLHIYQKPDGEYQVMTAIPINAEIPVNKTVEIKRMIRGKILVADITGGPHSIRQAEQQMENYVLDYRRASPAIPFQSMITERISQPDTSRWITRLYYPVL